MNPKDEHPNHRAAQQAFAERNLDAARPLFESCIAHAEQAGNDSWLTYYLQELARLEAEAGNPKAFHALHQRAISIYPNAPLLRMYYARDIWTLLKDRDACLSLIADVEELVASDRWDKAQDLAPLAYQQKLETLRAWTRGEEGGPLWP